MPMFRLEAPTNVAAYCYVEAATPEEALELSSTADWHLTDSQCDFDVDDPYEIEDMESEERFEVMEGRVLRPKEEDEDATPRSEEGGAT